MKFCSAFATLILAAISVEASSHDIFAHQQRHGQVARRDKAPSCSRRHPPTVDTSHSARQTSAAPTSAAPSSAPSPAPKPKPKVQAQVKADIAYSGSCKNKAAGPIAANGGPNGSQKWLNCGIDGDGWNPPYIGIDDLKTVDLNSARRTAFASCSDEVIGLFYKYGRVYNIPPILIASFAMQESGCNPDTVGGAGEQGLMQITTEKCQGRGPEDCRELDFNIRTGAGYFSSQLQAHGGNVVLTVGSYNGYFKGMTYHDATKAAKTDCCRCQNNLDYLQQFFNGWLQGYNAYSSPITLGTYFNLNACFKG